MYVGYFIMILMNCIKCVNALINWVVASSHLKQCVFEKECIIIFSLIEYLGQVTQTSKILQLWYNKLKGMSKV